MHNVRVWNEVRKRCILYRIDFNVIDNQAGIAVIPRWIPFIGFHIEI